MAFLAGEARALVAAVHSTKSRSLRFRHPTSVLLRASSCSQKILPPPSTGLDQWLDVELPEGRCVGVGLEKEELFLSAESRTDPNHWAHEFYHPEELLYGTNLSKARQVSFWLGRLSMRIALDYSHRDHPILKDTYGRPQLPVDTFGSISHKGNYGIALVSRDQKLAGIGVDLEHASRKGKKNIGTRVLTDNELLDLGKLPGISAEEEVLLRFSLKEAIYKAAHPLLCQYVGFKEAEVTPHPDGSATCKWLLESGLDSRIVRQTAHWRKLESQDFFLTSASVQGDLN